MGKVEYILGMTQHNFYMVGLQEPRTPTDHRMVLGVLFGEGVTRHRAYVTGRTTWPIREEKGRTRQNEGASHFRALKRKVKKPLSKDRTISAPWILDTTWKLADQRMALGRNSRANQVERMVLTRRLQVALMEEMRSRVKRVREEIEALVSNYQVKEAWGKIKRWYPEAKGNRFPPISEQLDQT